MSRGRQIKIHLADGSVTGIRHAEIMGWTGQALSIPRNRISDIGQWPETQKPGVYFLFGDLGNSVKPGVYIGETEEVATRLKQHLNEKDFWNEAVCFTNKDENLTKAHVKYLECRLIELTQAANRFALDNDNTPTLSTLARGDIDVMEEFLANIRVLIGTLGHKLLEPLFGKNDNTEQENRQPTKKPRLLVLKTKNIKAAAIMTDEGIVVRAGSEAALDAKSTLSPGYAARRDVLIDTSMLVKEKDKRIFASKMLFDSPSQAAAIILGYPANGRELWKTSTGQSLKQLEEEG